QTHTRQSHYTRIYPSSDLLSTGVLRPVPEQYLRISLPKGTVPLKDTYTPSRSWSSLHNPKRNYNTLDPTSISMEIEDIVCMQCSDMFSHNKCMDVREKRGKTLTFQTI
ncbi:hypothetical protein Taro_021883, partial [Colocasia esculenta]|nr:hypothetical protein [Colocasia esculenta]